MSDYIQTAPIDCIGISTFSTIKVSALSKVLKGPSILFKTRRLSAFYFVHVGSIGQNIKTLNWVDFLISSSPTKDTS